jgi:tetratricopeptide (TPR) repeat protein
LTANAQRHIFIKLWDKSEAEGTRNTATSETPVPLAVIVTDSTQIKQTTIKTKMEFNQDNKVIQLCTKGMELEGQGNPEDASNHFKEAWSLATTNFEKFTAAHYVARHQINISDKLQWDEEALKYALQIDDEAVKGTLPSLYLNIGKCHEDLNDFRNAKSNYEVAFSFTHFLPDNGYGNMIKTGIINGLDRVR